MAIVVYQSGIDAWAQGRIAWLASGGSDIRAVLVDASYTPNASTHETLEDVPGARRIKASGSLSKSDALDGECKAAKTTVPSVPSDTIAGIVVYKHTGTENTSTLICCITEDTDDPPNPLSLVANGGDVDIDWGGGSGVVLDFSAA